MINGPLIVRLLLVAVVLIALWYALRPRWDFLIELRRGTVLVRGNLPQAKRGRIEAFFARDVAVGDGVTIKGRRSRGRLELQIDGPVPPDVRQQIRNFLVTTL